MATFVLVHAPLAGSTAWKSVAEKLGRRGHDAVMPGLIDWASVRPPYWRGFAEALVARVRPSIGDPSQIVLVAHSGAGMILPLLGYALELPVAAYVFVDAVVPSDGMDPNADGYFDSIAVDGLIPPFTDQVLRAIGIEDDDLRARFVDELRPLPLAVYRERVRVPTGWPDAPCAFLRFTKTIGSAYEPSAHRAKLDRWPYRELDGGHFHMLVDPDAVAAAIVALTQACGVTNHQ